MKTNRKGFTLIELLAVIVILAVIALIATPLIMGTITKARQNSAVDSAYGYMKAVEQAIGEAQVDDPTGAFDISGATVTVSGSGDEAGTQVTITFAGSSQASRTLDVNYKGSQPDNGGTLTYDTNGRVASGSLHIGGYDVTISNDKATIAAS